MKRGGLGFARVPIAMTALVAMVAAGCNWLLGFEDEYRVPEGTSTGDGCTGASCGPIRHVAAGGSFACVLLEDGTVTCWGGNEVGQLGARPEDDAGQACPASRPCRWQPRTIPMGDVKFTAIAAGYDFACALATVREGNTPIYCWGSNEFSQLGHAKGTLDDDHTCNDIDGDPVACNWIPHEVTGLTGEYVNLAAGWESVCAARSDGATFCWGSNGKSVRGTTAADAGVAPNRVNAPRDPLNTGYESVSLSIGNPRACGRVRGDKLAHCWGDNRCLDQRGSLGDDLGSDHTATPITVYKAQANEPLSGVVRTITLVGASCAAANDGVWCWGSNFYGALGLDGESDVVRARRVPGVAVVNPLSGSFHHACAIATSASDASSAKAGEISCWGLNGAGQLGRGTIDDDDACLARDKRKCGKAAAVIPGFDAVDISSGADFNVALRADGTVWAWGSNQSGKCGQPADSDAGLQVCAGGEPCIPSPRRVMGIGPAE